MYVFSAHIRSRMSERAISEAEINEILYSEVAILVIASKSDDSVDLIMGNVSGKWIAVIVNRLTKNLITVRCLREKEKRSCMEAFND